MESNPGLGSGLPGASGQTQFTQWATYCFPIPPGGQTSTTQIQWSQIYDSTADYDHWGLDNIQVFVADPFYGFIDETGAVISTNTIVDYPTSDTTYNYIYTNGINDTCSASVSVSVNPTDAGPDVLVACDGLGRQINVTGVAPWATVSWTPSATLDDASSPNPIATPLVDTEYFVTSACGVDSVNVFVEDVFTIDILEPDTICLNGSTTLNLSTSPNTVPIASVEWSNFQTLNSDTGFQVLASPYITTQYVATVTSDSGCVIQDSVTVQVQGVASLVEVNPKPLETCMNTPFDMTASPQLSTLPYTLIQTAYAPYPITGTVLGGFTANNTQGPLSISFSFPFFGNNYSGIYLSSNGWISFTPPAGNFLTPTAIPNAANPNNIIAWAWDNLDFTNSGTFSYYEGGTAPNRYLVLNFIDVAHSGSTARVSVQVVLYENGLIEIHNIDVQPNGTFGLMTQGIENSNGTVGVFNTAYNYTNFSAVGESWSYIPYVAPVNPTYTWSPSDYLNTTTGATVTTTPPGTTEYTVVMQDGFCTSQAVVTVVVDTISIDSISNDVALTCPDDSIQLYVDASTTVEMAAQDSIYQLGYNTQSTGVGTPYEGFWEDGRLQVIYSAADLLAEGLQPGSNINGIAFNVINKGSSAPYQGFTIGMQHTNLNALTAFVQTGFTTTFNPANVTTALGWNWHMFNNSFQWDGVSNVLIQVCYDNSNWTSDDDVQYTETLTNTVAYDYTDGVVGCTINSPSFSNDRPNLRIRTDYVPSGFAPITYQWSSNPSYTFDDDTIFNPLILDEVDQVTEVYVEVSDGTCSIIDTVIIDFSGGLTLTPDTVICQGDSVQLEATGGTNVVWTASNTLSDTSIPNPIAFPTTTTTYEVSVDLANCSITGLVEVAVSEIETPIINGGISQIGTCLDEPIDLTSNADVLNTNTWTGPENGSGVDLTVNTSGLYTLTSTTDAGCSRTADILVNIANPVTLDTDRIRNILCCNDAVTIVFDSLVSNGIGVNEVYWNGSATPTLGPVTLYSDDDGVYSIRVIDENGCENTAEFELETKCNDVVIEDVESIILGETHDYSVYTSDLYDEENWYPIDAFTNNVFSANNNGENIVYVNIFNNFVLNNGSDYSCVVSDSSSIIVISISNPEMPDAFSPNGDGLNETFFPVNLDPNSSIQEFVIYNRWGEEVYRYNNDNGWDGKWNDIDQPVDTYTYYLNINKTNDNYINSGTLTLIR